MVKRASLVLGFLAVTFTLAVSAWSPASTRLDPVGVVAHEWGTFTSVAGPDGTAVDWLPVGGPVDLPCFVDRYKNLRLVKVNLGLSRPLTYNEAPRVLRGKVRTETPVVYFYSPADATVDVRVTFPRGLMTEWYPRATVRQPEFTPGSLSRINITSTIEWRDVKVSPRSIENYPVEPGPSHYYAARATDASPVLVNGQQEKFLFYRGVASFDVPVSALTTSDGGVRVKSLGSHGLRSVILFENRGGRLGFRVHGALHGEATVAAPASLADPAAIRAELERALTDAGLYPREARAMVETWRDSWFEEGTRIFYVLAPQDVDRLLPLDIQPAPRHVARVFVGRTEVITPDVMTAVGAAIASRDGATLERHGRFLGAIADRLMTAGTTDAERAQISDVTNAAFGAYLDRFAACPAQQ